MQCNKKLTDIQNIFNISLEEIRKFIVAFHSEMEKGLSGEKSSLKMLQTYIQKPKGTEKGSFLALDLGGTNFRVSMLKLKGKRKPSIPLVKKFVLKKKHIRDTSRRLFDFIAGSIKSFMEEHKVDIGKEHNIGFTFSFPIRKKAVASGILVRWTKGFSAKDVEGEDVVRLLNQSLKRNGLRNTKVVALANDTVSTLVAKSYEDPNCDVGVILGTGTNACYYEKSRKMIVNIEWGNFNKLRLTLYDKELDKLSGNPGEQLLEKMISGMYLGELVRLVIKSHIPSFNKLKDFKAEYVSAIERDTSKNLFRINTLLKKIGIPSLKCTDRKFLKKACIIISTRAACMSATAIASVITKMDPGLSRKHTVAIDGSVYEKHPGFPRRINSTLKEIFGRKAKNIKLSLTKDASVKGAAIIAANERI